MPLLTLTEAQLAYGELPLLDRAALAMEAGERIGLIGRNGSGKSSLLGVIADRVALDAGELRKRDGLRIALVEQEPSLLQKSSVREALLARAPEIAEHKLAEFLDRFKVDPQLAPQAASGGEAKRAVLALALALEPDLLLLDEPTNHLDVQCIEVLESLVLRQASAIVVTHDRAFLDRVATRILELDRGLIKS
jgi:ATP-binding cassette subfamily F protein uup